MDMKRMPIQLFFLNKYVFANRLQNEKGFLIH